MHLEEQMLVFMLFGQVANFKTNSKIDIQKFAIAINSRLKNSILIKEAEEVEERFHARYNAKGKKYRYVINNSLQGSAIYRDLEYHMPIKLDVEKMANALKHFEGEHDFKGFRSSGTSSKNSVRTIYKAEIKQEDERIIIELTGNGFMYNMVRIIAGTIVDVGLRKNSTRRHTRNNKFQGQKQSRKDSTSTRTLSSRSVLLGSVRCDV